MNSIQGNPYTATRKTTHVQKLADGTTITRVTTAIDARDSQGRTYHEDALSMLPGNNEKHVIVTDPIAHTTTTWFSSGKQATRMHWPEFRRSVPPAGATGLGSGSGVISAGVSSGLGGAAMVTGSKGVSAATNPNLRPEIHREKLGGKTIANVYAEGTRTTITFPAGFMGNDGPITTVSESWMSPDLKIVVLSTNDDPRSGVQTTELTNLDRAEPDPSLFQVPEGHTIKDEYPQPNQGPE